VAYPLESSLIGIVRIKEKTRNISPNKVPTREIKKVHRYGYLFEKQKKSLKDLLTKQNGVALFGAGHLACGYVNFFDISKTVKFFVDDDTHKKNMYMAKSGLPIYQSDMLLHKKIQMCLLSLNPRNEDRIIESNKEFIKKGGKFFSIFPSSAHALTLYV
jgi:hypothetical protein